MVSVIKGRFVGWWGVLACRTWFLQMHLDVSSQKTPYWSCQKTGPRGATNSAGHGFSRYGDPMALSHADLRARFRACFDISFSHSGWRSVPTVDLGGTSTRRIGALAAAARVQQEGPAMDSG